MADVRSVLDHLLEGRTVLVAEVDRLTAAIADLDAVIGRLGGAGATPAPVAAAPPPPTAEPVTGSRGASRRAPAARRPVTRPAAAGEGGKSIRVHVLEMLESEQREMGLAEIIDRVHAAGIQAHDDAVRSITIKLMKDGKVERVGRGQYRVAGGSGSGAVVAADTPEPVVDEFRSTDGPVSGNADASPAEPPAADTVAGPVITPADPEPGTAGYTPPLNLGQPWQQP